MDTSRLPKLINWAGIALIIIGSILAINEVNSFRDAVGAVSGLLGQGEQKPSFMGLFMKAITFNAPPSIAGDAPNNFPSVLFWLGVVLTAGSFGMKALRKPQTQL